MSDWKQSSLDRRDFRHTHGGPEVPPHRKKSKKIDRSKCDHEYSEWSDSHSWYFGKPIVEEYPNRTVITRSKFGYRNRYCLKCKKRNYASYTEKQVTVRNSDGRVLSERLTRLNDKW